MSYTIGIDVGKKKFHLVGLDKRDAIVPQQKVTCHQLGRRLGNTPRCQRLMSVPRPFECTKTYAVAPQAA